jgi:RNA recognition motif-containing protein
MKIVKRKQITRGIFIKNVSYNANINSIESLLSKYSIIYNDIIMFYDKLNIFKGKIIIILNNEEAATEAIKKLKNQMFLNRKLKVTYAYNKYVNNNDIVNLFDNKLNLI